LYGLVFLEMVVLDSLSVLGYSIHSYYAFVLGKKFCCRGKVGEDDERYNSPCYRDGAEDDEDVLPFLQPGCDMSYCITNESSEHCSYAICAVVYFETEGLLGGRVPDRHHEDEAGVDGCLDGAEEETVCGDAAEVDACGSGDEDYAPGDGGIGEEFSNRKLLEEVP
jgi:hypothetical protein